MAVTCEMGRCAPSGAHVAAAAPAGAATRNGGAEKSAASRPSVKRCQSRGLAHASSKAPTGAWLGRSVATAVLLWVVAASSALEGASAAAAAAKAKAPVVKWGQKADKLYLTIPLTD